MVEAEGSLVPIAPPAIQEEYVKDDEELSEPIDDCDGCPERIDNVRIDMQIWYELQHIKDLQKGKEFAVYLLGAFNPIDGVPEVNGYYIPEQEVTAGSADITEENLPPEVMDRIIGHLHSHHTMGAHPSGVDNHHRNWPVHIIISDKENSAIIRKKATCGRVIKSDAQIKIQFDVSGIQGLDKIKDGVYKWKPTVEAKPKKFTINDYRKNMDAKQFGLTDEDLELIGY